MVLLSKLLDLGLRNAKCQDVYHPGKTCLKFQFEHSLNYLTAIMKFFFPIAVIPLLTKGRNLRIRDALTYYTETIITGYLIAQTNPIALCGTRAFSGQFSKSNILFIPNMISTWPMLFTTARVARLFATSIFQVALEAMIRSEKNLVSRTIRRSKLVKTTLFMIFSTFILHAAQRHDVKLFWIIKAIPSPKQHESKKCVHDGPCAKFCLKEIAKTLLFGIPLDLFKMFSKTSSNGTSFTNALVKKLHNLDFPTTLFFSSYTGIYNLTSCLLTRTQSGNRQVKHITAAFLGGISFIFLPQLTVLCYGAAVCVEIMWNLFKRYKFKNDNTSKFVEIVRKIPFHRLLTMVGAGLLGHLYCLSSNHINQLGVTIIEALSGNRSPHMRKDIHEYLINLDKSITSKSFL